MDCGWSCCWTRMEPSRYRRYPEEIEATRLYLACMALAPREDLGVLLEINKDETDHVALISSLISRQTGRDADYAAMVPGVD